MREKYFEGATFAQHVLLYQACPRRYGLEMSGQHARLFEQGWKTYARMARLALCRQLIKKIEAREIRDLVYEQLVVPQMISVVPYGSAKEECLSEHPQVCAFSRFAPSFAFDLVWKNNMQDLWQCNQVGHTVMTELVQTWYRVNTFKIVDALLIPDFAISDRWQLEVVPREHISHVEFAFDQSQMWSYGPHSNPPIALRELRSSLERLAYLRSNTNVTIHIKSLAHTQNDVPLWERDACDVLEFVEQLDFAVFGILRRLNDKGLSLTFIIDNMLSMYIEDTKELEYDACAKAILKWQ